MRRYAIALLISLLTIASAPWAEGDAVTINDLMGSDDPRLLLTLEEAVAQVREETGGRVVSAKTIHQDGALVHRIEVVTPQNTREIHEIEAGDAR